jgi:peptidoglycan-associated lipoprotein
MKIVAVTLALVIVVGCDPHRPGTPVRPSPLDHKPAPHEIVPVPGERPSSPPPASDDRFVAPAAPETPRPDPLALLAEANGRLLDIYFDYDSAELRVSAVAGVQRNAELLAPALHSFGGLTIRIEGHCDERGSAEYNLALGHSRAARVADELSAFGVARERLRTISYGRERPQCAESAESCWQRNRRAHLEARAPEN